MAVKILNKDIATLMEALDGHGFRIDPYMHDALVKVSDKLNRLEELDKANNEDIGKYISDLLSVGCRAGITVKVGL